MIAEKTIPYIKGGDDRTEHNMAWSTLNRNNKCPIGSIQTKEGVISTDQQQSRKIDQSIKNVKFLERFTLVIVVIFAISLLVQQGSLCISK